MVRFSLFLLIFWPLCAFPSVFGWQYDMRKPEGFVLANNYFGFNLLNQLSAQNDRQPVRENIFFSPYSVAVVMSMLHQGSGGNTSAELNSVLGYQLAKLDKSDKATLAGQIKQWNKAVFLTESDPVKANYTLKSGNALVANKQFTVRDEYKQSLKDNFDAELFVMDFAKDSQAVMDLVNTWAAEKTNQKIKKLMSKPPTPATQLALANAVYFKGNWKLPFDKKLTKLDTFAGLNGAKFEQVPFMNIKGIYKVVEMNELGAWLVELPYQGDQLSMFAILPMNKSDDLKPIKKALSPWYLESAICRSEFMRVEIQFPKLDFKTESDLMPPLEAMGITEVFNVGKSDLSGISDDKVAVSSVKHVATIEVNEEGSEASAATIVNVVEMAPLPPIKPTLLKFDHPFLFLIRHNQNGQILFVGEVNKF